MCEREVQNLGGDNICEGVALIERPQMAQDKRPKKSKLQEISRDIRAICRLLS